MPSSQTMSYKYNADGIRTQKTFTDNNQRYYYKHDYILDGSNIVAETITYFTYFGTGSTETLYYYYDEAGAPTGIKYNNNVYFFQKNLQGDIIRILNSSGTIVATYTYDAWGNIISSTDTSGVSIGTKNPFRYRGYYYDTETGLYYLNSRYYDPQVGRFLNADDVSFLGANGTINGYNLYSYCLNNPVIISDPTGHFGLLALTITVIAVGGIVGGALGAFSAATTGGNVIESVIEGSINGMIGSACGLFFTNPFAAALVAGVGSFVVDLATQATVQYIENENVELAEIDFERSSRTAIQTGIGAAVPAYENGAGNTVDAIGTAVIWAETSTLITSTDVIISNIKDKNKQTSDSKKQNNNHIISSKVKNILTDRRVII